MPALDAIAAGNNTAGANFGTATVAAGDSLSIRNFPQTTRAQLLGAFSQHVTSAQFFRVRSPLLHDNVQGIRIIPAALVSEGPLVGEPLQELYAQDTLIIEASTAAATGVAEIVLPIYYDQLPGADARLYAPGDVLPLVKAIKPLLVTPASGANAFNVWFDSNLTDDESLLHANTDYAVLGIVTDVALAALAIKGIDTGNLRCAVPGVLRPELTRRYFVDQSYALGKPCIPVINAANAGSTQLSIISSAATAAVTNAQIILAELAQNLG